MNRAGYVRGFLLRIDADFCVNTRGYGIGPLAPARIAARITVRVHRRPRIAGDSG
jgi:hypothetical protein